jgi:hypothetical protein
MWSVGWGTEMDHQKQFICTKRGGEGFFGRVSRVMAVNDQFNILSISWRETMIRCSLVLRKDLNLTS